MRRKLFLLLSIALILPPIASRAQDNALMEKFCQERQHWKEISAVMRRPDGLHKAALLLDDKTYVTTGMERPWVGGGGGSFASLVADSDEIFIGVVKAHRAELIDNGRRLDTHYVIQVERAFKGDLQPGQAVDFVLPGGKITFDDGSSAEVITTSLAPIEDGHTYVLFTNRLSGQPLRPSGWDQSIFELSPDGHSVLPHASAEWDPTREMGTLTQDEFLHDVQRDVSADDRTR